jgi:putative Holliday junction resolvase
MPSGAITVTNEWLLWISLRRINKKAAETQHFASHHFLYLCTNIQSALGRIVAIDYGQKRTGIAVTDPLQIIAGRLTTLPSGDVLSFLIAYTDKEAVDSFVVGYPRQMNNSPSESVLFIDPFINKLKNTFPDKPVFLMDERFTSKMAVQAMVMGGVKKKDRQNKALIDGVSATIILQSYLEYRENNKSKNIE